MGRLLIALCFTLVLSAAAPDNQVVVKNPTRHALTNYPLTFRRALAQGEFANWVKPMVNGAEPAKWQNDNPVRWHDGAAACTITAVTNTTPPEVTCANHGFRAGDSVRISGANLAALNGTHRIVYLSRDKFLLNGESAPGVFSGTATAAGPGPGSLQTVDISLIVPSLVPGNNVITFAPSDMRTSDPSYRDPGASDLTGFNNGNWGAAQEYTATSRTSPTIAWTLTPNLGTMSGNTYTAPATISTPQIIQADGVVVGQPSRTVRGNIRLLPFKTIRVNSGGPDYTDSDGNLWVADTGYTGGSYWGPDGGGTGIYLESRAVENSPGASFSYAFTVPNGGYNVTLKMMEPWPSARNCSTVTINGAEVLTNYCPFNDAGQHVAIDKTFPVTVASGSITVVVAEPATSNLAMLQALQIASTASLPAFPAQTAETGGLSMPVKQFDVSANGTATLNVYDPSTITKTVNAKAMINTGNWRLWRSGPALWEVIAEDPSSAQTYDFGTTCTSNCSGYYDTAAWDDSTNKIIHPSFVLSMYSGWPGVRLEYIGESDNSTALQDQRYTIRFLSGPALATVKYGPAAHTLYAMTRWSSRVVSEMWDGTAPTPVNINHGFEYLKYTGLVPNYDTNVPYTSAHADAEVAMYNSLNLNYTMASGNGGYNPDFGATGGRWELGLFTRWNVSALRSGDSRLTEIMIRNAYVGGHIPAHVRETAGKYFLDANGDRTADAVDAWGRFVSVESRPTLNLTGGENMQPQDNVVRLPGCCSPAHGWQVDAAHSANFAFGAWLITGSYYLQKEVQAWAALYPARQNPGMWYLGGHVGSYGVIGSDLQTRGSAWAFRHLTHGYLVSPDGSPEKEYFYTRANNTAALWEGTQRITGGDHFLPLRGWTAATPCPSYSNEGTERVQASPYCFGYSYYSPFQATGNPLGFIDRNDIYAWCLDTDSNHSLVAWHGCNEGFHEDFLRITVGYANEAAPEFRLERYLRAIGKWRYNVWTNPVLNKYVANTYRRPYRSAEGDPTYGTWYWTSWADYMNVWGTYKTKNYWNTNGNASSDDCAMDTSDGYFHYDRAALSFLVALDAVDGVARARDAWTTLWNETDFTQYATTMIGAGKNYPDLRWAINPRYQPVRATATAGDTFVILEYVKPRPDEACTVDGVSDGVTDSRLVRFVKAGLTANSSGTIAITCASGSTSVAYTTLAGLSGIGSYKWTRAGQARLNYGSTPALGNSTAIQDCSSGCSVALSKGLWYVQLERQGGARGGVEPVVVR